MHEPSAGKEGPTEEWIDLLCLVWAEYRSPLLGALIRDDRLVARGNLRHRALSALKSQNPAILVQERETLLPFWLDACTDVDDQIAAYAKDLLRQERDPVYFFTFAQWSDFQSSPTCWQRLIAFYASQGKWRDQIRTVAENHHRLDWVSAMTDNLDPDTFSDLTQPELEAAFKILLQHRRWADCVQLVRRASESLSLAAWDRIIAHHRKTLPEALWHIAYVCPLVIAARCIKYIREDKWEPEDSQERDRLTWIPIPATSIEWSGRLPHTLTSSELKKMQKESANSSSVRDSLIFVLWAQRQQLWAVNPVAEESRESTGRFAIISDQEPSISTQQLAEC